MIGRSIAESLRSAMERDDWRTSDLAWAVIYTDDYSIYLKEESTEEEKAEFFARLELEWESDLCEAIVMLGTRYWLDFVLNDDQYNGRWVLCSSPVKPLECLR